MKKRKIKLFASVASLAMVAAVMGVGVWAATSQSVTVNSTVEFAATGIEATVKLDVAGAAASQAMLDETTDLYTAEAQEIYSVDLTTTNEATDNGTAAVALKLVDVNNDGFFGAADTTGEGNAIVYTFTIKNDSATIPMYVDVTATTVTGWNTEIEAQDDAVLKTGAVGGSESITVTATFTYTGANVSSIQAETAIPSITVALKNAAFTA